jgi:hypothetical protein
MKYTAFVLAIALSSISFSSLPASAVSPKSSTETPSHRGGSRRVTQPKTESPTHRGGTRRVSGKDFCDAKCGSPDAPQGTGSR